MNLVSSVSRNFYESGFVKSFFSYKKVWFIGQLASYLMRFNTQFSKKIKDKEKYLGFKRPCVG
jgi:hypothetical protein